MADSPYDQFSSSGQNVQGLLGDFGADRNIFGRAGKLFKQRFVPNPNASPGSGEPAQIPGEFQWMANVTEISATMTIDRLEVRRQGDRFVKYKAGEVTGEGTLTFDKINSEFEQDFVAYVKAARDPSILSQTGGALPFYYLTISLEDPGMPEIEYDTASNFAEDGHEEVILKCVQFWSMPFGFSIADIVTRDVDFTFTDIDFGGTTSDPKIIKSANLPTRLC